MRRRPLAQVIPDIPTKFPTEKRESVTGKRSESKLVNCPRPGFHSCLNQAFTLVTLRLRVKWGFFANYRNRALIFTVNPYKNPTAPSSKTKPKTLMTHAGRRFQGSIVRLRNDSGLRTSPTPHHTYATAQTRKNKGLNTGAKKLSLLPKGRIMMAIVQTEKIIQPVNESALNLPESALR